MKITKEAKIGLVIVALLATVYWGFNFLKGRDLFRLTNDYTILYDRIDGLKGSDAVYIKGYKVGQVSGIIFNPENTKLVTVRITIGADIKIPLKSTVKIFSTDLMGSKGIEIMLYDTNAIYADKSTIAGSVDETLVEQIAPIKNKVVNILGSADTLLQSLNNVIDIDTKKSIHTSLDNIEAFSKLLVAQRASLDKVIKNLEVFSNSLSSSNMNISDIFKDLSNITDSLSTSNLKSAINNLNGAADEIRILATKLNEGKGSAGLFLNNDSLYNHVDSLSKNIDQLIIDIRQNPKKYVHFSVFGRNKKQ